MYKKIKIINIYVFKKKNNNNIYILVEFASFVFELEYNRLSAEN
jgi:hypothetical protein